MKRILALAALIAVAYALFALGQKGAEVPAVALPEGTSVQVTLALDGMESANYSVPAGTTVFELMRGKMPIAYKEYAGLGALITCINTRCQNSTHYWQYYVNGGLAPVGVSFYKIEQPIRIEWRLEIPAF